MGAGGGGEVTVDDVPDFGRVVVVGVRFDSDGNDERDVRTGWGWGWCVCVCVR